MPKVVTMDSRPFPRTPHSASVVGLGTWQLGADWGEVSEADARAVLEASAEAGVTFYDTADVYGDGRSEQIVGPLRRGPRRRRLHGRDQDGSPRWSRCRRTTSSPTSAPGSTDRARNLGVDTIDLVQLHCPPSEVIDDDATYDVLDQLVAEGSSRHTASASRPATRR